MANDNDNGQNITQTAATDQPVVVSSPAAAPKAHPAHAILDELKTALKTPWERGEAWFRDKLEELRKTL